MTFDEFIQDGLGKANKLFGKLAQTGPNAVKTRERLFLDLKAELVHLGRFEKHHLIPALGDQKKTRPLVKALEKDSEKVAALLAELDTAPRAGDGFLERLTDLQEAFQAHVRDERKQLLPAVLDALQKAQAAEHTAAQEAADLEAARLKAAEIKAAQAEAEAMAGLATAGAPGDETATTDEPAATLDAEPGEAETFFEPRAPAPVPLAAIGILQTLATPLAPAPKLPAELPKSIAMPLPTSVYGVQAWANLMQEAADGAMLGYRLMMAYSNNSALAGLQTRLMKEQIELMTKSGSKMVEAVQRLTKPAG